MSPNIKRPTQASTTTHKPVKRKQWYYESPYRFDQRLVDAVRARLSVRLAKWTNNSSSGTPKQPPAAVSKRLKVQCHPRRKCDTCGIHKSQKNKRETQILVPAPTRASNQSNFFSGDPERSIKLHEPGQPLLSAFTKPEDATKKQVFTKPETKTVVKNHVVPAPSRALNQSSFFSGDPERSIKLHERGQPVVKNHVVPAPSRALNQSSFFSGDPERSIKLHERGQPALLSAFTKPVDATKKQVLAYPETETAGRKHRVTPCPRALYHLALRHLEADNNSAAVHLFRKAAALGYEIATRGKVIAEGSNSKVRRRSNCTGGGRGGGASAQEEVEEEEHQHRNRRRKSNSTGGGGGGSSAQEEGDREQQHRRTQCRTELEVGKPLTEGSPVLKCPPPVGTQAEAQWQQPHVNSFTLYSNIQTDTETGLYNSSRLHRSPAAAAL